jgi:hypothetical protein
VDFATDDTEMREVFSSQVTASSEDISRLSLVKSQLFRFDLSADSPDSDHGVQLSFYDARTGDIVTSIAAAAGSIRTQYVWLGAGDYFIRSTFLSRTGNGASSVAFTLRADGISDDQGPNPIDPTQPPSDIAMPDWDWEDVPMEEPPIAINYVEPLFEDPWHSDYIDYFYALYYDEFLTAVP